MARSLRTPASLFAAQHGVARRDQMALSDCQIRLRVKRGVLEPMPFGVFRTAGAVESELQRLSVAVLSAGSTARASHASAAWLWGFGPVPDVFDVTSRPNVQLRDGAFRHHRSRIDAVSTVRTGIVCSSPLQTLGELGGVARERNVEACLDDFVRRKLASVSAVVGWRTERGGHGRRGFGVLGAVLERRLVDGHMTDSQLEALFARLVAGSSVDGFEMHRRIRTGNQFVVVDFCHVEARVVIELDGFAFHGNEVAFQRDRQRDANLTADGWTVLRFTWRDVVDRPTIVLDQIRRTIQSRRRAA
jgi:very-short-patch-repair endonuclease